MLRFSRSTIFRARCALSLLPVILLSACPTTGGNPDVSDYANELLYETGFEVGFKRDDAYWRGYNDSYDTQGYPPTRYAANTYPYYEELSYSAGYWDGIWYAYNDGFFTSYRYGFIVGFSEGYDTAYYEDYLAFLAADRHIEYGTGSWQDGYNDGFSEGRIFGAADYEAGLTPEWLLALYDYEAGEDLEFAEVGVGTEGSNYPVVILYEYGVDPDAPTKAQHQRPLRKQVDGGDVSDGRPDSGLFRPLQPAARRQLDQRPQTSARSDRSLTLTTTWLERIEAYQNP